MTQEVKEHLSAKQDKAIAALVTSRTREAAAAVAGVHPRTLARWINEDPLFEIEYRSARRQALDYAIACLQSGAVEAVEALRNALGDRSVHVRVRAAGILLEHALAAHQSFELEQRIKLLEEASGETTTW